MKLRAIGYVSTAVRLLGQADLDGLLLDARAFNEEVHVTGALLYDKGAFFQYFEGPDPGMTEVYERIRNSKTHHRIIELLNRPVAERAFGEWHMGFSAAPGTLLQQLANTKWNESVRELEQAQSRSLGLELLLEFWSSARRTRG
jgi:hypothetical protein